MRAISHDREPNPQNDTRSPFRFLVNFSSPPSESQIHSAQQHWGQQGRVGKSTGRMVRVINITQLLASLNQPKAVASCEAVIVKYICVTCIPFIRVSSEGSVTCHTKSLKLGSDTGILFVVFTVEVQGSETRQRADLCYPSFIPITIDEMFYICQLRTNIVLQKEYEAEKEVKM
jgi:hypothetical protein